MDVATVDQEQLQMQALLQSLHDFAVNTLQQVPQTQSVAPVQAVPEPQGGGILSHFRGGGFGQAMTQGVGMGVGFGLADSVISSIFN